MSHKCGLHKNVKAECCQICLHEELATVQAKLEASEKRCGELEALTVSMGECLDNDFSCMVCDKSFTERKCADCIRWEQKLEVLKEYKALNPTDTTKEDCNDSKKTLNAFEQMIKDDNEEEWGM